MQRLLASFLVYRRSTNFPLLLFDFEPSRPLRRTSLLHGDVRVPNFLSSRLPRDIFH
jgi:hypothetical protein